MESQPEQISYSWAFQVLHHLRPDSAFAVYPRRSRLRQRLFELFDCLSRFEKKKYLFCLVVRRVLLCLIFFGGFSSSLEELEIVILFRFLRLFN